MRMNNSGHQNIKVAFIGLGVMGGPMAGHLARNGYPTTVYNRSPSRVEHWLEVNQGTVAETPAGVAKNADMVFACVGNDDDLRQVTLGEDGAFASMKRGSIFIDHTTASANIARELGEKAEDAGFEFLDAPVSGGQAGAENGALTVMVGGRQQVFDRARPVISSFAQAVTLMGRAGSGQLTKMVNQTAIAGLLQGLSEAVNFAGKAGLDVDLVIDVISKGAAQSWQMENRAKTMARDEFDFGFAVDWMRKDLGLVLSEAQSNGARLPLTALIDQFYAQIQDRQGGRWDTSSLIRLLSST